mmetsp:Transcript_15792/g.17605  ORF Transcript_15792/g.17605 Transcript_15792/m.17605 type:complete len:764 (-) Transcript_15792:574-2865(-)
MSDDDSSEISLEIETSVPTERRMWTPEEDAALKDLVEKLGERKWTIIATKMTEIFGEERRSSKQCRERWHNHLDPAVNKRAFSKKEESILFDLQRQHGNCWSKIAKFLPGRTDNALKNHFYSTLRKKLRCLLRNKISGFSREMLNFKNLSQDQSTKILDAYDQLSREQRVKPKKKKKEPVKKGEGRKRKFATLTEEEKKQIQIPDIVLNGENDGTTAGGKKEYTEFLNDFLQSQFVVDLLSKTPGTKKSKLKKSIKAAANSKKGKKKQKVEPEEDGDDEDEDVEDHEEDDEEDNREQIPDGSHQFMNPDAFLQPEDVTQAVQTYYADKYDNSPDGAKILNFFSTPDNIRMLTNTIERLRREKNLSNVKNATQLFEDIPDADDVLDNGGEEYYDPQSNREGGHIGGNFDQTPSGLLDTPVLGNGLSTVGQKSVASNRTLNFNDPSETAGHNFFTSPDLFSMRAGQIGGGDSEFGGKDISTGFTPLMTQKPSVSMTGMNKSHTVNATLPQEIGDDEVNAKGGAFDNSKHQYIDDSPFISLDTVPRQPKNTHTSVKANVPSLNFESPLTSGLTLASPHISNSVTTPYGGSGNPNPLLGTNAPNLGRGYGIDKRTPGSSMSAGSQNAFRFPSRYNSSSGTSDASMKRREEENGGTAIAMGTYGANVSRLSHRGDHYGRSQTPTGSASGEKKALYSSERLIDKIQSGANSIEGGDQLDIQLDEINSLNASPSAMLMGTRIRSFNSEPSEDGGSSETSFRNSLMSTHRR